MFDTMTDDELQRQVDELRRQYRNFGFQLEPGDKELSAPEFVQAILALIHKDREARQEAEERSHSNTIEQRDNAEEWADKLAYAIAPVEQIGEHSSMNNPWAEALEYLEYRKLYTDQELEDMLATRQPMPDQELDTFLDEVLDSLATKIHNLSPGDVGSFDRVLFPIAQAKTRLHERFAAERSRLMREAVEALPGNKYQVDPMQETYDIEAAYNDGFNACRADAIATLQSLQTREKR